MSVGSAGKWLGLALMVSAAGAIGCGGSSDDNAEDTGTHDASSSSDSGSSHDAGTSSDSGSSDSGSSSDGGGSSDAGKDAAPLHPPVTCGSLTCAEYSPSALVPAFAPGCVVDDKDAAACGLSTSSLMLDGGPEFILKDAPGVASQSCGDFYDGFEPDAGPDGGVNSTKGNHKIETKVTVGALGELTISYPGCCTIKGFCSGDTNMGIVAGSPSKGGYGCMDNQVFFAKQPAQVRAIPCDPTSGMIKVPSGGDAGTDAGTDAGDGGH